MNIIKSWEQELWSNKFQNLNPDFFDAMWDIAYDIKCDAPRHKLYKAKEEWRVLENCLMGLGYI